MSTVDLGSAVHNIVPALQHLAMPIGLFIPSEDNPNEGDVGAMTVQLKARGQHRPLVYQEGTHRIIAGEHLWRGALALDWTHLAAIPVDEDDLEADARMVGDNLPGRLSRDRDDVLARVLGRLRDAGKLEAAGYDDSDLGDTLRRLEVPSLEALKAAHGEPQEHDFWPTVKVKVHPAVFDGWSRLVQAEGGDEAAAFEALVKAQLAARG